MLEPVSREEVMDALRNWGPMLPLQVKRKLGKGESTMIGAVLSELAHHGKVAITKVKKGGSPYYYLPEKFELLERVADALGEKDKRTFDLLKQKRVIDPTTVDPLTRVSLGQIPDYSKKFEHDGKEYYRYFVVTEAEAKLLLKTPEATPTSQPEPVEEPKPVEEPAAEKPKPAKPASKPKPAPKAESKPAKPKTTPKKATPKQAKQQTLAEPVVPEPDDQFLKRLKRYCTNKKLELLEYAIVRKESEIDLTVRVPTTVGKVQYFAKAKSKKKSNDGDVAAALLAAQRKQLPVMYITTGEVTKKAKEMEELKGVLIKEIKP